MIYGRDGRICHPCSGSGGLYGVIMEEEKTYLLLTEGEGGGDLRVILDFIAMITLLLLLMMMMMIVRRRAAGGGGFGYVWGLRCWCYIRRRRSGWRWGVFSACGGYCTTL